MMTKVLVLFGCFCMSIFYPNVSYANNECDYHKAKAAFKENIAEIMKKSVVLICPELMDTTLRAEKENAIFASTKEFMDSMVPYLSNEIQNLKGKLEGDPEEKALATRMKTITLLSSFLNEKCPDLIKKSKQCLARKSFEDSLKTVKDKANQILAEEESERKQMELVDSDAEGVKGEFCAHKKTIQKLQENIKNEKEVGRMSGVVNLKTLHDNAARILHSNKRIEMLKKQYQEETGKSFPKSFNCSGYEQLN